MRRTLARTRDTLDVPVAAPGRRHRTQPPDPRLVRRGGAALHHPRPALT